MNGSNRSGRRFDLAVIGGTLVMIACCAAGPLVIGGLGSVALGGTLGLAIGGLALVATCLVVGGLVISRGRRC
jgi:hypothetical protein